MTAADTHPYGYHVWFAGLDRGLPFTAEVDILSPEPFASLEHLQSSEAPKIAANNGYTDVNIYRFEIF
jgi:hypothetical protein